MDCRGVGDNLLQRPRTDRSKVDRDLWDYFSPNGRNSSGDSYRCRQEDFEAVHDPARGYLSGGNQIISADYDNTVAVAQALYGHTRMHCRIVSRSSVIRRGS
jgi:hypothetical protein